MADSLFKTLFEAAQNRNTSLKRIEAFPGCGNASIKNVRAIYAD
jgi:hypothetical protein